MTTPSTPKPLTTKTQKSAIDALLKERQYQEQKWPGHKHSAAEWILILQKLVNDAERAWVTGRGDNQAMHEVRQIGATALACMEQCGVFYRGEAVSGRKYPGPHPHHTYDELNPAD